jgi:hypothetical protein
MLVAILILVPLAIVATIIMCSLTVSSICSREEEKRENLSGDIL